MNQQETSNETYKAMLGRIASAANNSDVDVFEHIDKQLDNLYNNNCLSMHHYKKLTLKNTELWMRRLSNS